MPDPGVGNEPPPAVDQCGGCDRTWVGNFNPVREYCHKNPINGFTSCRQCSKFAFFNINIPWCGNVTDAR